MHAVGQGALGVEIRSGDREMQQLLRSIGHWETEWRCAAERGLLRVLEGGCSVPVGVETTLVEITSTASGSTPRGEANGTSTHVNPSEDMAEEGYAESSFPPLTPSSPLLHFSGIYPPTYPLPSTHTPPAEISQILLPRRATLKLSASVTSLDGRTHVVYDAPEQIVASWRGAQAWGEECARRLRGMGAGEVLDEINEQRRAREAADEERRRAAAVETANGAGAEAAIDGSA